jgi:hypothetical protein
MVIGAKPSSLSPAALLDWSWSPPLDFPVRFKVQPTLLKKSSQPSMHEARGRGRAVAAMCAANARTGGRSPRPTRQVRTQECLEWTPPICRDLTLPCGGLHTAPDARGTCVCTPYRVAYVYQVSGAVIMITPSRPGNVQLWLG